MLDPNHSILHHTTRTERVKSRQKGKENSPASSFLPILPFLSLPPSSSTVPFSTSSTFPFPLGLLDLFPPPGSHLRKLENDEVFRRRGSSRKSPSSDVGPSVPGTASLEVDEDSSCCCCCWEEEEEGKANVFFVTVAKLFSGAGIDEVMDEGVGTGTGTEDEAGKGAFFEAGGAADGGEKKV